MSGSVSLFGIPLTFTSGWVQQLQPASFRGVPFQVDSHDETGGRRLARTSYPGRDKPTVEDLGQAQDGWRIRGYVLADVATQDYFAARDALRVACRASGPATLIHPYLGRLTVACESVTVRESVAQGGIAIFDLVFWDSGTGPGPTVASSTASGLLAGANSVLSLAIQAFAIGSLIAERPGILLGIAEGALGGLVSSLTGLQPAILSQLGNLIGALVGSAGNSVPITSAVTGFTGDPAAIAVSDVFSQAATLISDSAGNPPAVTDDPVYGQTLSLARQAPDPTLGLAPLATWSPPSQSATTGLAANLQTQLTQQLTALVCTSAVAALTQIYANTAWASSNAAAAARTNLLGWINTQLLAAAAADEDALYQGLLGLAGLASADLLQRAQSLPSLAPYATPASLPSQVLAQRLLQDATQADSLVALNDAVHPSFMPTTGVWLAPT